MGPGLFHHVLVNSNHTVKLNLNGHNGASSTHLVKSADGIVEAGYTLVMADVIDTAEPRRHDPKKLAQSILRIYYDRGHIITANGTPRDSDVEKVLAQVDA